VTVQLLSNPETFLKNHNQLSNKIIIIKFKANLKTIPVLTRLSMGLSFHKILCHFIAHENVKNYDIIIYLFLFFFTPNGETIKGTFSDHFRQIMS